MPVAACRCGWRDSFPDDDRAAQALRDHEDDDPDHVGVVIT